MKLQEYAIINWTLKSFRSENLILSYKHQKLECLKHYRKQLKKIHCVRGCFYNEHFPIVNILESGVWFVLDMSIPNNPNYLCSKYYFPHSWTKNQFTNLLTEAHTRHLLKLFVKVNNDTVKLISKTMKVRYWIIS